MTKKPDEVIASSVLLEANLPFNVFPRQNVPKMAKTQIAKQASLGTKQSLWSVSDSVKVALISSLTSVLVALITVIGAAMLKDAKEREDIPKEAKDILPDPVTFAPLASPESAESIVKLETFVVSVDFNDSAKTTSTPEIDRDICVLTAVASYGGATKGCSLVKSAGGWVLKANGRKATSTCEATCFDLSTK